MNHWLSLYPTHILNVEYESLVDEAELIEANPQYAHVRLRNGRETTVSLRDLAPYTPCRAESPEFQDDPLHTVTETSENLMPHNNGEAPSLPSVAPAAPVMEATPEPVVVRRSSRVSVPPVRLIEEIGCMF